MSGFWSRPYVWYSVGFAELSLFIGALIFMRLPQIWIIAFVAFMFIQAFVQKSRGLNRDCIEETCLGQVLSFAWVGFSVTVMRNIDPVIFISVGLVIGVTIMLFSMTYWDDQFNDGPPKELHMPMLNLRRRWAAIRAKDWHEAKIAGQLLLHPAWQILLGTVALCFILGLGDITGSVPMSKGIIFEASAIVLAIGLLSWWEGDTWALSSSMLGALLGSVILLTLTLMGIVPSGAVLLGVVMVIVIIYVLILLSFWEMEPEAKSTFWFQ